MALPDPSHHSQNIRGLKKELAPTQTVTDSEEKSDFKDYAEFVPPAKGTPADVALQANAELKISRLTKGIRKIRGIKHPKVKNVTKGFTRKKKQERFSRNFKGKVIDGVHELYTLTAGMMLGIRCSVSRANPNGLQSLKLGDFNYVEKISFPPDGNSHGPFRTPPHSLAHTFKFKTYAPSVFSRIREFFGVDSINYMLSVCGNYNYLEFISNSKSGQFFFYSHDGRYMIKTQTNEENKFMKRILPHYYRYVTEHPHTFLVRIYGMHRVKMYHLNRKVHFVIMGSVFDTPAQINKIYDLKGSLVGRNATAHERESGGVLKDNDLIQDHVKLQLGSKKESFLQQIEKDATFLSELNIMDYSLLVGIHHRSSRFQMATQETRSGVIEESQQHVSSGGNLSHVHSNTPFRQKEPQSVPSLTHALPVSTPSLLQSTSINNSTKQIHKGISNTVTSPPSDTPPRSRGKSIPKSGRKASSEAPSLPSVNGVVQLELPPVDQPDQQLVLENIQSYDSHSVASDNSDIDYDEDEDEEDDGDSDVEFDEELMKTYLSSMGYRGSLKKSFDRENDDEDENDDHEQRQKNVVIEDVLLNLPNNPNMVGLGLSGEEGKAVRVLINPRQDLTEMSREAEKEMKIERLSTFGPGAANHHPWSSRVDCGINSRLQNEKRGDEIYFLGIIDILQQYNASKRMETFVKGFNNDRAQISSVDSVSYAKRFVAFLRDNTA